MLITNIQRFSLHDGPGIRTTVFMKGCPLRCPWCSNPENQNIYCEEYTIADKKGIYGIDFTVEQVYNEIIKDKNYYGTNGGVTFSGGEPLLQANKLMPLLKKIKKENISIAVETSLFIPQETILTVLPYVDYFYIDMKILNSQRCKKIILGDIELFKKNIKYLSEFKKNIIIRIPLIGGYTDDNENIELIIKEILNIRDAIIRIEIIKGHNLGDSKYVSLGLQKPSYIKIDDNELFIIKKRIVKETNLPVVIDKI